MGTTDGLRHLDDRFLRAQDVDKEAVRAARWLPWVLAFAFLVHFASLFAESLAVDGIVSGAVVTAFVAAVQVRRARTSR